jgi:hypothetical protein
MRDQYSGDLSDYIKFALLRALACEDRTLGMAWYYIPGHDGRNDGHHLEWRKDLAWRALDPELFDALCNLPERSIAALERLKIWPKGTVFHREPVPSRLLRVQWAAQMRETMANGNLIFLDPDNGLGAHPKKHATFADVRGFRAPSRSLVSIKFPAMENYESQVQKLHERLKAETGTILGFTLLTNVAVSRADDPRYFVQRSRWFSVIDSDATLLDRASRYAAALSSIPRAKARIIKFEPDQQ